MIGGCFPLASGSLRRCALRPLQRGQRRFSAWKEPGRIFRRSTSCAASVLNQKFIEEFAMWGGPSGRPFHTRDNVTIIGSIAQALVPVGRRRTTATFVGPISMR